MYYFFSTNVLDDRILLSKEESAHCINVLRHKVEDTIYIVNGKGSRFFCKISNIDNGCVSANILEKKELLNGSNYYVHIVLSPTKSSRRFEWFVEKAVEIGINEISFIKCSNSERGKINIKRLKKIALTAMKQSLKASLPKINDIEEFNITINKISEKHKYIGYLNDISNNFLNNLAPKNNSYCLFIGPEGDFTNTEINMAIELDFIPVLLGNSRLRTETAALSGCLMLNQINYGK